MICIQKRFLFKLAVSVKADNPVGTGNELESPLGCGVKNSDHDSL
jgi:hypothetical protein